MRKDGIWLLKTFLYFVFKENVTAWMKDCRSWVVEGDKVTQTLKVVECKTFRPSHFNKQQERTTITKKKSAQGKGKIY